MSDPHPLAGHHGADIRPQFLAGVVLRAEAFFEALLQRIQVHPIRMPRGVAHHCLVVGVGRGEAVALSIFDQLAGPVLDGL